MRHVRVAAPNKTPLPFSSAMPCGSASKGVFLRGYAATVCAGRAIADGPRRNCRPERSRRPLTWFVFVRCCNGHSWDSPLDPHAPCLLLLVCDHVWRHDVRTKFPSRVFHTPVVHRYVDTQRSVCLRILLFLHGDLRDCPALQLDQADQERTVTASEGKPVALRNSLTTTSAERWGSLWRRAISLLPGHHGVTRAASSPDRNCMIKTSFSPSVSITLGSCLCTVKEPHRDPMRAIGR